MESLPCPDTSLRYGEVLAWAQQRGANLGALEEQVRWHTSAAELTSPAATLHIRPRCARLQGHSRELHLAASALLDGVLCAECGFAPARAESYALSARALMGFERLISAAALGCWGEIADLAAALRSRGWAEAAGVPTALEEVNATLVSRGWEVYTQALAVARERDAGGVERRCLLELAIGRTRSEEDAPFRFAEALDPEIARLERAHRLWRDGWERGTRSPRRAAFWSLSLGDMLPGRRRAIRTAVDRWEDRLAEVSRPHVGAPVRLLVLPRGFLGGAALLEAVGLRFAAVEAAVVAAPRAPAAVIVPAAVASWTTTRAGTTGAAVDLGPASPGEGDQLLRTLLQITDPALLGIPPTTFEEIAALEEELAAALTSARAAFS